MRSLGCFQRLGVECIFLNFTSCGSYCYFWASLFGLSYTKPRFVFSLALPHWSENAAPWGYWTEQVQSFPGGDSHLCANRSSSLH